MGFGDWAVIDDTAENGLTAVNWSVIPRDWTNPGVSVIVDRIMEQMHPGAIILLHDGDSTKIRCVQRRNNTGSISHYRQTVCGRYKFCYRQ